MSRLFIGFSAAITALVLVGCPASDDRGGPAATDEQQWTTVTTLRSTDPTFQDLDNMLVSDPFTTTGDVRLVMNMPDAGRVDGIVGVIMAADKATDLRTLLQGVREGVGVTIIGAAPQQVISGLDGTYVFMNSIPANREWSLEIQVLEIQVKSN